MSRLIGFIEINSQLVKEITGEQDPENKNQQHTQVERSPV
jgi:hypothetical protein